MDSCLASPNRPSKTKGKPACTASRDMLRRATTRGHVATTKLRAKLHRVEIQQHDSSWCHVVGGNIVARFDCVTQAVDALARP